MSINRGFHTVSGVGGLFTPTYITHNSIYANVLNATKRVLPLSCPKDFAKDSLFMRRPDGILSKLQTTDGNPWIVQIQPTLLSHYLFMANVVNRFSEAKSHI